MQSDKKVLSIPQAIEYQRAHYGCVAYGRDALYAVARSGKVPIIRNGERRIFFPVGSIDRLMQGSEGGK